MVTMKLMIPINVLATVEASKLTIKSALPFRPTPGTFSNLAEQEETSNGEIYLWDTAINMSYKNSYSLFHIRQNYDGNYKQQQQHWETTT